MPQKGKWADIYETWLSIKGICTVCRNHNTVIISSFVNFLTDQNGEDFWTGANDIDIERDWVWESDNSKLLFSDWHVGEPNNKHNEDCGQMRRNNSPYRWNDAKCQNVHLYICEK
jgi:hypothetical protein